MDDLALLQAYARAGSESAFATVVQRHVALVHSAACRQVRDAQSAEDVTQAVFIILAQKAGQLGGHPGLSGWLLKTTRYVASAQIRAAIRRTKREQEAVMQSFNETEPSLPGGTANLWEQLAPVLDEAMASLGDTDRAALALRYFENKSGEEIGQTLGMNERAAQKRVSRALEKLRKFFGKRGLALSAAAIAAAVSANSVQAAPAALAKAVTVVAVAKGAAAGTSTLTLVTGALKIMAWTKTKTAIITGAAILLAGVIATTVVAGHWRNAHRTEIVRHTLPTGNVTPMVAYGYSRYVVILASDGSLWSWGEERLGWPVLGLSNTKIQNTASLRRIGQDADWRSVSVGDAECLAIKADGSLWGWGGNYNYQLGDGTKKTRPTPVRSVPGNDWKQAAAGTSSFALKNDGTLWAWGNNWSGKLGTGNTNRTEGRQAVQVGSSTNWTRIECDGIQAVGLQSDGSLWFWGALTGSSKDEHKFLVPTRVSPDSNWVDVGFGYFTMFALKSDGTLWVFGNKARFYAPSGDTSRLAPAQIGAENDWQAMSSAPGCFYLLLRKKDGSLWVLDASEHRTVKSDKDYKPLAFRKIDFPKDIAAFAAGGDNIGIVLSGDGEVWTWGRVIGEHSQKDFLGPKGQELQPEYRDADEPWQVSVIDAGQMLAVENAK